MPVRLLRLLVLVGLFFSLSPTTSPAIPIHVWSGVFGDSPNTQSGQAVAIDAAGNVVVVGSFIGTIDLGGGPMGPTTGGKDSDVFVAKFDPAGNHLWSKRFGDPDNQFPAGVALDSGGNVLFAVNQSGTVDYGGGPLTALAFDVVIVKLDASGSHVWSKRFGDGIGQAPNDVAVDPSDNVLVTGLFDGTLDFGCGPMSSANGIDMFVAKLDPTGACLWSKRAGDNNMQIGNTVATDPSGNVFVAGDFSGSIDFGGGALTSAGSTDMFLAKLDPNGAHLWSKRFGDATGTESATSIACDAAGHVSLAGQVNCVPPGKFDPPCTSTIDFGGGPLTGAGGYDVVLADFDASGAHQWSKLFGDAANQSAASVAIDSDGDRFYFGTYVGTIDFGTGPLTAPGQNLFLAQFSSSGSVKWASEYGQAGSAQYSYDVGANSGKLAITGRNGGTVNFGGGPITSGSIGDVFVAKFSDDETVPVAISSFTATARNAGIDVRWSVSHDEELSSFSLYRRAGDATQPVEIASGSFNAANASYFDKKVAPATTYHYELLVRARSGDEFRSPVVAATTPGLTTALGQNRPNPFNPATTIEYSVTERTRVVVGIYDATGALVTRLDEGVREAGTFTVKWDGRDATGKPAGSGVYFYRLEGTRGTAARKMVLLK
jgi:FlgD Ig-like domain/Beta-propeller repeat